MEERALDRRPSRASRQRLRRDRRLPAVSVRRIPDLRSARPCGLYRSRAEPTRRRRSSRSDRRQGRIIRPTAFDSAADGTFVVADAPGDQQRLQFFSQPVRRSAASRMPGRGVPQITLGDMSSAASARSSTPGQTILMSQPELGALVDGVPADRRTACARSASCARPARRRIRTSTRAERRHHRRRTPRAATTSCSCRACRCSASTTRTGTLVFERHIEGVEMDPYLARMPTTWPRRRAGQ